MTNTAVLKTTRNQRFDIFRILFASMVILAHAPELIDGNRNREIWNRLTHSGDTFGTVAVDGFFILSGFLIVQSWQRDPEFLNFLRKRLLRIVPGFVVASILSVVAVGALAPGTPHFFRQLGLPYIKSLLVLGVPNTPPLLPGMPYPVANGSFWTLAYEVRCYLLTALLGVLRIVRQRYIWLALTLLLLLGAVNSQTTAHWHWHTRNNTFVGDVGPDFHLTAAFFVGGCFHLFQDKIRFNRICLLVATLGLLLVHVFNPGKLEIALILFGGYLLFYLAQVPTARLSHLSAFPDISYGMYLYGFPIESLWLWYSHGSPWRAAAGSILLAAGIGWISWHFVERPMLKWKRRSTTTLAVP